MQKGRGGHGLLVRGGGVGGGMAGVLGVRRWAVLLVGLMGSSVASAAWTFVGWGGTSWVWETPSCAVSWQCSDVPIFSAGVSAWVVYGAPARLHATCSGGGGKMDVVHLACVSVCPSDTVETSGACVAPPDPPEKDCSQEKSIPYSAGGVKVAFCGETIDIGGCQYFQSGDCICVGDNCMGWSFKPTGEATGSGGGGGPAPQWMACPPGQVVTNVGGMEVCVVPPNPSKSVSPGEPKVTETKAPDGTGERVGRQRKTTCVGDDCTTTDETTRTPLGPDGSPSGPGQTTSEKTTQGKSSFCAENPQASVCASGSFTGNCTNGFQCSGDAVACATARAAWDSHCKVHGESESSTKGKLGRLNGGTTEGAGPSSVDVGGGLGAAMAQRFLTPNCIPSAQITVLGRTYVADTAQLCSFASIMGYVLVALASVVAIRMIGT